MTRGIFSPGVGADLLRHLEEVALEVLGEDDPAYELPPDKRWMASLHKKVLTHSQTLPPASQKPSRCWPRSPGTCLTPSIFQVGSIKSSAGY